MSNGIPKITKPVGRRSLKKKLELNARIDLIEDLAEKYCWDYWGWSNGLKYQKRVGMKDEYLIAKIYLRKNGKYVVETELRHPKKGYKKLRRDEIDIDMLKHIFENPRVHTGLGKYIK